METIGQGIFLDYETSDRITLLNLIDIKQRLLEELEKYPNIHKSDVAEHCLTIDAASKLIEYFGGEARL